METGERRSKVGRSKKQKRIPKAKKSRDAL
jgi:hypothetical protein